MGAMPVAGRASGDRKQIVCACVCVCVCEGVTGRGTGDSWGVEMLLAVEGTHVTESTVAKPGGHWEGVLRAGSLHPMSS